MTKIGIISPENKGLVSYNWCLSHKTSSTVIDGRPVDILHDFYTLCCFLFGSAAWYCASRDIFIGWSEDARKVNLKFLTNNTRFLILSWVKVLYLASHILGLSCGV
ncbi:Druantia anti-phage system protein DruA [Desulfofarcimen acetoxidans]|uniref:Druantia anti-phage system protein DruA n=1 Tax=Desulfofarcimen acetoxidans TaxID=58138 RepID=UPI00068BC8EA